MLLLPSLAEARSGGGDTKNPVPIGIAKGWGKGQLPLLHKGREGNDPLLSSLNDIPWEEKIYLLGAVQSFVSPGNVERTEKLTSLETIRHPTGSPPTLTRVAKKNKTIALFMEEEIFDRTKKEAKRRVSRRGILHEEKKKKPWKKKKFFRLRIDVLECWK